MRFIHTADWQIGKVFKQFGAKEENLRQARLTAIERIGLLARENHASHVLVAGDVYDSEAPNSITLRAPIERMKQFPDVHWHLLPGNHDPHRPEGAWDRVLQVGLPSHIHAHLTPTPALLGDSAVLLPAPVVRKSAYDDITAWMNDATTPAGLLRIGLAHGAIKNFGSESEAVNPIEPSRAAQARLDYLALGDWHRTIQVSPTVWYAGTPEPDRAGRQERGTALLVDIQAPGATPSVTQLTTGTFRWLTRTEQLNESSELADFERRLREEPDLSRLILRLRLEGALPLAVHADLRERLTGLEAALFHLDFDETSLVARPTQADLEAIDFDGVLRRSADRLKSTADDQMQNPDIRRTAQEALVELYLRAVGRPAVGGA